MFTFNSKKIEDFTIELTRPLSSGEIGAAMEQAFCHTMLPDKSPFSVPLKDLVSIEQTDNPLILKGAPNLDAVDEQAVRWCQALTMLPPKSLPRSQRPVIKLLKKLPPLPTGNAAYDRGRRAVLDQTLSSLWPAIRNGISEEIQAKAKQPPRVQATRASE